MNQLVSVIILNYDGKNNNSITLECVRSFLDQTYTNFEIILVDNGSEKKYFYELKEKISQFQNSMNIKLVRFEENLFFTGGNNNAIKISSGKYICLLNNDTEVLSDFIEKMVEFLENHPDAGFICPKVNLFSNKTHIWYAGGVINFRNENLVKIKGQWRKEANNFNHSQISKTDFAAGVALFTKLDTIKKLGLLDGAFLFYHEDVDWNLRAQKMGYVNYYVPTTTIYHKVSESIKANRILFSKFFFVRNSQILVWKHAKLTDFILYYFKFAKVNLPEFLFYLFLIFTPIKIIRNSPNFRNFARKHKKIYKYLTFLLLNSILRGFIIGLKRKLGISCKNNIIKDLNFTRKMIEKIKTLKIGEISIILSLYSAKMLH